LAKIGETDPLFSLLIVDYILCVGEKLGSSFLNSEGWKGTVEKTKEIEISHTLRFPSHHS
jgi:hypothetical protein